MVTINLINGTKDMRDVYIANVEVLGKVKQLALLPDGEHMTLRQVADYYEIDIEVVRKTIQRHRDEFISDGMIKLSGKKLTEFKETLPCSVPELHKVPSTQILPRQAILRMGMVLKNSKIAEKIRTYLLEAEKLITTEQKNIIFQGSWTDEIDQYIISRVIEEKEKGVKLNDAIQTLSLEVGATVHQIKNYYYVGGQGKDPLRTRLSLNQVKIEDKTGNEDSFVTKTEILTSSGYSDLFAFGEEVEKENLIKEQNKLIQSLMTEMEKMKADNDELKNMLKDIYHMVKK